MQTKSDSFATYTYIQINLTKTPTKKLLYIVHCLYVYKDAKKEVVVHSEYTKTSIKSVCICSIKWTKPQPTLGLVYKTMCYENLWELLRRNWFLTTSFKTETDRLKLAASVAKEIFCLHSAQRFLHLNRYIEAAIHTSRDICCMNIWHIQWITMCWLLSK